MLEFREFLDFGIKKGYLRLEYKAVVGGKLVVWIPTCCICDPPFPINL